MDLVCSSQYAGAPCPPPPPHFPPPGLLPFTGFSAFAVVGLAVALIALGLIVRFWGYEPDAPDAPGGRIYPGDDA